MYMVTNIKLWKITDKMLPSESKELISLAQRRQTMNTITDVQLSNLESQ